MIQTGMSFGQPCLFYQLQNFVGVYLNRECFKDQEASFSPCWSSAIWQSYSPVLSLAAHKQKYLKVT